MLLKVKVFNKFISKLTSKMIFNKLISKLTSKSENVISNPNSKILDFKIITNF